jgi:hypothetical protein
MAAQKDLSMTVGVEATQEIFESLGGVPMVEPTEGSPDTAYIGESWPMGDAVKCVCCGVSGSVWSAAGTHMMSVGLESLVRLHGIELRDCKHCGAHSVGIPRLESLMRAIAVAVCSKAGVLTAPEIRFVGRVLGGGWEVFGEDMAQHAAEILRPGEAMSVGRLVFEFDAVALAWKRI